VVAFLESGDQVEGSLSGEYVVGGLAGVVQESVFGVEEVLGDVAG
jgi:hypothetical protein